MVFLFCIPIINFFWYGMSNLNLVKPLLLDTSWHHVHVTSYSVTTINVEYV
jgi:hypothetical protein